MNTNTVVVSLVALFLGSWYCFLCVCKQAGIDGTDMAPLARATNSSDLYVALWTAADYAPGLHHIVVVVADSAGRTKSFSQRFVLSAFGHVTTLLLLILNIN
jgi:hypothetical protein